MRKSAFLLGVLSLLLYGLVPSYSLEDPIAKVVENWSAEKVKVTIRGNPVIIQLPDFFLGIVPFDADSNMVISEESGVIRIRSENILPSASVDVRIMGNNVIVEKADFRNDLTFWIVMDSSSFPLVLTRSGQVFRKIILK